MSEVHNTSFERERVRAGLRWFGPDDTVTIQNIRQTPGVTNVISALHHIPPGEVWTDEAIAQRKVEIEFLPNPQTPQGLTGLELYRWHYENSKKSGLVWDTAESLVFTEDIKNGSPGRDAHIENYKKSLRNLGRFGVENVVGNFMLVADWTRTDLIHLDDDSIALEYIHDAFAAFDIYILRRHKTEEEYVADGSYNQKEVESARTYWKKHLADNSERRDTLEKMITAGLPGAQEGFTLEDFRHAVNQYKGMTVEALRKNIAYFLDAVVPMARDAGVRLCAHADDPAYSPFLGTPRAVGNVDGYKFLLDHGCGVNLCVGSLMPNENNRDITSLIYEIAKYGQSKGLSPEEVFPHIHLRPVETDGKNFREGHHAEHREELAKIVHALVDVGWAGVFRPDHAPTSDHGFGRPGYDVIGRGYGAQLLLGLFEMAEIVKTTRRSAVESAVKAANGDPAKLEDAHRAYVKRQAEDIGEKIPFIKRPFVFGESPAP